MKPWASYSNHIRFSFRTQKVTNKRVLFRELWRWKMNTWKPNLSIWHLLNNQIIFFIMSRSMADQPAIFPCNSSLSECHHLIIVFTFLYYLDFRTLRLTRGTFIFPVGIEFQNHQLLVSFNACKTTITIRFLLLKSAGTIWTALNLELVDQQYWHRDLALT